MKKTVCEKNRCNGCGACMEVCSKKAITIEDSLDALNANIDITRCINCGACFNVCPNNSPIIQKKPISCYQGWATDALEREKSSSGGFATILSKSFVLDGGVVCSCCFNRGNFIFEFADTIEDINKFRGSKYVKSNPSNVYQEVRGYLLRGRKVLFIGLPCQVAGMKNFVGDNLECNLYTVDLICHGTPSAKMLKKYLIDNGISLEDVSSISFRNNNNFMLLVNGKPLLDSRIQDSYTKTFLDSLNYTENCYSCNYSNELRVGDLTIGDAWGSNLKKEIDKGISLVLCQSEKGENLLQDLPFYFEPFDFEKAKAFNHQLRHPAKITKGRLKFFKVIKKGKSYNRAVAIVYPMFILKQFIKKLLLKLSLYR